MTKQERDKAKRMAVALRPYVDTLLMATAYAELERERVDKIHRQVLAEEVHLMDEKHLERGRTDERITDPKLAYLMCDVDAERYYAKLNAIHLANGFEDAAKGYCPALCAETLQREAEWALILAAEEFFPGVTNDKLLCGTGGKGNGLEVRQKYIDLMIGLVVNYPGYESPIKKFMATA